jgi:hypothetical protein
MHAYLPDLAALSSVAIAWGIAGVLVLVGAVLTGRREPPEICLGVGWGGLCLLLTAWGVLLPLSLRVPAIAVVVAAIGSLLVGRFRLPKGESRTLLRLVVLTLPLWLVMAPIRPSQPDTFLNLLPNALYLVDHGRFPISALPPSFSLLPAAPYNTQFLSFLGGLVDSGFPAAGMSLVNVMLCAVAGLAIARALAGERGAGVALPWGAVALGLLLAVPLNPGFVPRIDFAGYGEPALAVTALLSAVLFVRAQGRLAAGERTDGLVPLALVLAAMINAKQSGIGLVAAVGGAGAICLCSERATRRRGWLLFVCLSILPAALLYALWRYYVDHAGVAELTPLPLAAWNAAILPQILASGARVIAEKGVYFGFVAIAFGAVPILLRRQGWTPTTRLLALHAAAFILYNGFLMLAYVAQFSDEPGADAHSYFRYNTHLSLVLVLALALAARDLGIGAALARHRRHWPLAVAVVAAVLWPLAFAYRLRFDLAMPQPLVWDLASRMKPYLHNEDRVALLLPGDNGSVATMLGGILRDVPPRFSGLDLLARSTADAPALDDAARRGYSLALISCTQGDVAGLPNGVAAFLVHDATGWSKVATWPYPADATRERWQHILSWEPLCRHP